MFDFHEKRKIREWLFSVPAIVVLCAASAYLATSVYERYRKERETTQKRIERAAELDELRQRAALLEAEVARIQSARGIEEEVRDRFDVTKEGEQAVIIVDERPTTTSAPPPTAETGDAERTGRFQRLFFWRR